MIGSIVAMLNKGAKAQIISEGSMKEAELYVPHEGAGIAIRSRYSYGGAACIDQFLVAFRGTAAYIDSRGDPTCDLRSNIAAESRANASCTSD